MGDLVRRLTRAGEDVAVSIGQALVGGGGSGNTSAIGNASLPSTLDAHGPRAFLPYGSRPPPVIKMAVGAGVLAEVSPAAQALPLPHSTRRVSDWREVVALFAEKREMQVYSQLYKLVECHQFAPPHLEVFPREGTQANVTTRLAQGLSAWTGQRWMVSLAKVSATKTLAEEDESEKEAVFRDVADHPSIKPLLLAFPDARIVDIRDKMREESADVGVSTLADDPEMDDALSLLMNDDT